MNNKVTINTILERLGATDDWKDMRFGIYNRFDDEYYTARLRKLGYDADIDALHYKIIETGDLSPKSVKIYLENDIQCSIIVIGCMEIPNKHCIVVVKPKAYKMADFFAKVSEHNKK